MRVMKFGGSSLATTERLATVTRLVREAALRERIVVVTSAIAGVTDLLVGMVESNGPPTPGFLQDLSRRHLDLLGGGPGKAVFQGRLDTILGELRSLGEEAMKRRMWTPEARDRALGWGERAAALLLSARLQAEGVPARSVDGSDVIRTDSRFGAARISRSGTRHLARWTLGRLPDGLVPVVAGFSGGDPWGRPTTLGRGSSDLTATVLGAALSAREVEIWTDVDGVHDRDPNRHPDAIALSRLDYEQARGLAESGAKVLHPKTLDPLEPEGIPLRVRNTLRPTSPGTSITKVSKPETATGGDQRINLILAGATGGVGSTFLRQLQDLCPSLKREGLEVRVSGAFSSRAQVWHPDGILPGEVPDALATGGSSPDWDHVTRALVTNPPKNPVFVDCTASAEVSDCYLPILSAGMPVVTPNKLAGSGALDRYRSIREAAQRNGLSFKYETTVGAALPILRTVRELRRGGDRFRRIEGVLSGTLSYVFSRLAGGSLFSEAVREARDLGFTEPHPKEDLAGADVARKLLILLREAGFEMELEAIPVESLVPESLELENEPDAFLRGLKDFDHLWSRRIEEEGGESLSYIAGFEGGTAEVGVRALPRGHPLSHLRPTENRVVLTTDRYPEVPLTIAGPGAGREVTASGVLADFLQIVRDRYQGGRGRRVA